MLTGLVVDQGDAMRPEGRGHVLQCLVERSSSCAAAAAREQYADLEQAR